MGERFDTIVLDPPAFAKSKAAIPKALSGYKEINLRALKLLNPGGISHHVQLFVPRQRSGVRRGRLRRGARRAGRRERRGEADAGPGSPVVLGMPETYYLKCFILRKLALTRLSQPQRRSGRLLTQTNTSVSAGLEIGQLQRYDCRVKPTSSRASAASGFARNRCLRRGDRARRGRAVGLAQQVGIVHQIRRVARVGIPSPLEPSHAARPCRRRRRGRCRPRSSPRCSRGRTTPRRRRAVHEGRLERLPQI